MWDRHRPAVDTVSSSRSQHHSARSAAYRSNSSLAMRFSRITRTHRRRRWMYSSSISPKGTLASSCRPFLGCDYLKKPNNGQSDLYGSTQGTAVSTMRWLMERGASPARPRLVEHFRGSRGRDSARISETPSRAIRWAVAVETPRRLAASRTLSPRS